MYILLAEVDPGLIEMSPVHIHLGHIRFENLLVKIVVVLITCVITTQWKY